MFDGAGMLTYTDLAPDRQVDSTDGRAGLVAEADRAVRPSESTLPGAGPRAPYPVLSDAQANAQRAIAAWMRQPDVLQNLSALYAGDEPSEAWLASAQSILNQFHNGELQVRVELRSSAELIGAKGAYAARSPQGDPVIYLNADWLAARDTSATEVAGVLAEEWGHHLDTLLNGSRDTRGDEGEAFAHAVLGLALEDAEATRVA